MDRRAKYDVGGGGGGGGKSFRSSDGGGEYGKAWKKSDPYEDMAENYRNSELKRYLTKGNERGDAFRQKMDIKEMTTNMRRESALDRYNDVVAKREIEKSIASPKRMVDRVDKAVAAVGAGAAAGAGYAASREKASKGNPTGKAEIRIKKGNKEKDYEE